MASSGRLDSGLVMFMCPMMRVGGGKCRSRRYEDGSVGGGGAIAQ